MKERILVTGATGYIGGRLVPRLFERGSFVRCLVRDPRKLEAKSWAQHERVEIVSGDAADPAVLARALAGCHATYYLVHSMVAAGENYREQDLRLARSFAEEAARAGVSRIVYLGGLGEMGEGLSEHLRSRREVEETLASGATPVTVFRAAMIIGSGSASFEILRYLVERLPAMVTPKWVRTKAQPIAIRNTLEYLVRCLDVPETIGRTFDIGGQDVLTYEEIMQVMAHCLGLRKRLIVPVPVLTPKLSSLWIHLITPIDRHLARPLAEGLRNPVVCRDDSAILLMPQRLLGVREAIEAALGIAAEDDAETTWSDAGPIPGDPDWAGGKSFTDRRAAHVHASPEVIFRALSLLGGPYGWHSGHWLWTLRGAIDRLLGGPGIGRGRRRRSRVAYGDALDFWRVTQAVPGKLLQLRAEMKLPGEALLEFKIDPGIDGASTLLQTARFRPRGLAGLLYWVTVLPFHAIVFSSMLRGIKAQAEAMEAAS